jgi:hypothetical protein
VTGVHIYIATGTCFQARVRLPGHKKYRLLGKPCRAMKTALQRMVKAMTEDRYKRGEVAELKALRKQHGC